MAEDKIAAAERAAIAEVRAKVAEAAAAAAEALIREGHSADADRAMVDQTIAGLGRTHDAWARGRAAGKQTLVHHRWEVCLRPAHAS